MSPSEKTRGMIRVDQAGEYGAGRIYAGQLAVMGSRAPGVRGVGAAVPVYQPYSYGLKNSTFQLNP